MAFIVHCIQIELELIWDLLVFGNRGINLTKQKREPTTNYASCRVRERSQNKLGTAKLESDSGASSNIVASLSPNQWKGGNGTLELLHLVVASSIIPVSLVFPASLFLAHPIAFTAGVSQQRKEQFHHFLNLMLKPPQKQLNPLLFRYKWIGLQLMSPFYLLVFN